MKKTYIPLLGVLLAALGALLFVLLPVTANLIIAYVFWLLAILFLIISVYALGAREKSLIMELPLFLKARGYLLVTAVISFVVLLLENLGVFTLPYALHIVAQAAALLLFGVQVTKLNLGKAHIEAAGTQAQAARGALNTLAAEVNAMKGRAASMPGVGKALSDVADALRYSDPISTPAVSALDERITFGVDELTRAVGEKQTEEILKETEALLKTIKERNERNKHAKG